MLQAFILLLMCSTCFEHLYINHQELATILLNYHIGRVVLGSMCVVLQPASLAARYIFFIRRGSGPNRFTRKYLPIFKFIH